MYKKGVIVWVSLSSCLQIQVNSSKLHRSPKESESETEGRKFSWNLFIYKMVSDTQAYFTLIRKVEE